MAPTKKKRVRPSVRVENLEPRTLLSVSPTDLSVPIDLGGLRVDTEAYHPSQILVRYREGVPDLKGVQVRPGMTVKDSLSLVPGLQKVQIDGGDIAAALAAFRADPAILYAEPDYRLRADIYPNDWDSGNSLHPGLWGLHNDGVRPIGPTGNLPPGTADADIDAPEAWDIHHGSGQTIVAVIDTGVNYNHVDLAENVWTNPYEVANGFDDDGNGYVDDIHGWDFVNNDNDPMDDNGHGTHVAGTIGAVGEGVIDYVLVGVNWDVQIMGLKFLDANGGGYLSNAITALNYAVANGAHVTNNSYDGGPFSQAFFDAIKAANDANVLFVAAAGNGDWLGRAINNDASPQYPASYNLPNVISVAATDKYDQIAPWSNYGATSVHLAAPGVEILSTWSYGASGPTNGYATSSGTSMAAPHVAGVAALVRDYANVVQGLNWSAADIKAQVLGAVDLLPGLNGKVLTGGRLNAHKALANPPTAPPETKFYVVNDATANRTYEYGADGKVVAGNMLDAGNSTPRGAASTAAGDKVWVVDANKKVYVYDSGGILLGSWTAGSLGTSATIEGIATNGTDVWIVDAKQDKVFRYNGAAGRLSGTQNAASSFSLSSGNSSPKDIVTDGVNLWVVNDASTDKVFKYTLAGSLAGSWSITGAGSSPTGITLDPSNVGHLWIADSGTDRVYQYDNAADRTSGSQAPSTSFALAAGNTNPQGIADPPTRGRVVPAEAPAIAGPSAQPTATRRDAAIVPAARRLTLIVPEPDRARPSIADVPTPSGPLAQRSRLTASRRRS